MQRFRGEDVDYPAAEDYREREDYPRDVETGWSVAETGRYRSNGEALEPRWRDGDSIPLGPLRAAAAGTTAIDAATASSDEEDNSDSSSSNDSRPREDYREERRRRRQRRPAGWYRSSKRYQDATNDYDYDYNNYGAGGEHQKATRYHDTFQGRPYEYELYDEYQKPRPRKRRPPQNYEFEEAVIEQEPSRDKVVETTTTTTASPPAATTLKEGGGWRSSTSVRNLLRTPADERAKDVNNNKNNNNNNNKETVVTSTTERMVTPSSSTEKFMIRILSPRDEQVQLSEADESTTATATTVKTTRWTPARGRSRNEINKRLAASNNNLATSGSSSSSTNRHTTVSGLPFSRRFNATQDRAVIAAAVPQVDAGNVTIFVTAIANDRATTQKPPAPATEDEIMEFSDFNTKKKSSSSTTVGPGPTRSTMGSIVIVDLEPTTTIATAATEKPLNLPSLIYGKKLDPLLADYPNQPSLIILSGGDDDDRNNKRNVKYESEGKIKKKDEAKISDAEPDAREEILELFTSDAASKRLERLLNSRNMSIEELIALRERGSSRVHLAEVATQKPTTKPTTARQNSWRGQKKFSKTTTSSTTTTTAAETIAEVEENKSSSSSHKIPPGMIEQLEESPEVFVTKVTAKLNSEESLTTTPNAPTEDNSWKNPTTRDNVQFDNVPLTTEQSSIVNEMQTESHLETITDNFQPIDNALDATNTDEGLMELNAEDEKSTTDNNSKDAPRKISSKVKPSIIASGVILGVTVVVFLSIFLICRIQQKQKYIYRGTLSRAVFQGAPAVTARKLSNTSSLNTIMVNVVATSTANRQCRPDYRATREEHDNRSYMDNDSLDANDSWETIPDFMK